MISLGSNNIGIGLAVSLHDRFSSRANAISSSMGTMHANAKRVMEDNLRFARQVGMGMVLAGAAMARGFTAAVKTSADFRYIMAGVAAITGETDTALSMLSDRALTIAKTTIFTAREVGSAMEYMARAGFNSGDIDSTIDAVTALGAATDTAIQGKGGASDMMTNMMTAFNMASKDSDRMADILVKATTRSNVDIHDLHESMKFLGSSATQVKMNFEEAAAMVAVLGNSGIRAGIAGRGLAQVLNYLAKAAGPFATKRQTDALTMMGIHPAQLVDAKGELKDVTSLLNTFTSAMAGLSGTQQLQLLGGMMEVRAARSLIPLFRDTKLGYNFADMLRIIRDESSGAADSIAKLRLDNLKGDSIILASAWETFKVEVGDALTPLLRVIIPGLTRMVNSLTEFAKTPIGRPIIILGAGLAAALLVAGPLLIAFTSIKLLALTSTASFANMGRTLNWAWNSSAASAARYAAIAQGATYVGAGGQFTAKGMKGFQSSKAIFGTAATAGSSGRLGIVGFIKNIFTATKGLGLLGRIAGVVTGPVGIIVTIIGALIGFKDMIKLVVYGLGTLLQGVFFIFDYIKDAANFDFTGTTARANFNRRQAILRKSMGLGEGSDKALDGLKPSGKYKYVGSFEEKLKAFSEEMEKRGNYKVNVAPTTVNIDGKKVADIVWDDIKSRVDSLSNKSN